MSDENRAEGHGDHSEQRRNENTDSQVQVQDNRVHSDGADQNPKGHSLRHTKINEEELKRLWKQKLSDKQIAEELSKLGNKVSQTGVTRARHRLGLEAHFSCKANKDKRTPAEMYQRSLDNAKAWKEANPERVKEQFRRWQKDNRERLNAYMRWFNKLKKLLLLQRIEEYNKEFYEHRAIPPRILEMPAKKENILVRGFKKAKAWIMSKLNKLRKWKFWRREA